MTIIRFLYLLFLFVTGSVLNSGINFDMLTFIIPSIFMGLGIAIDVALATLVRFKNANISWQNWTLPVTLIHILFAAFGYFTFWLLHQTIPALHMVLGITGFVFVFLFIYEVLVETLGAKPFFSLSEWISRLIGFSKNDSRTLVAILAVSWDALWSGPAKAAQAVAGAWSNMEVMLSFVIAGLVVAVVAEISLIIAQGLRRKRKSRKSLKWYFVSGKYLEMTVIGGFGVLSLWNAFSASANLFVSVAISAVLLFFVFVRYFRKIKLAEA